MTVKAYRIYHEGNTRIVFATSPGQAARVVAPRVPYRTDEHGITVVGDYIAIVEEVNA